MKELQITITGKAATGKTTMMILLEQFLKEKGFNVELDLKLELFDYDSEYQFRQLATKDLEKREEAMKNTKITLKTVQWIRDLTNDNTEK